MNLNIGASAIISSQLWLHFGAKTRTLSQYMAAPSLLVHNFYKPIDQDKNNFTKEKSIYLRTERPKRYPQYETQRQTPWDPKHLPFAAILVEIIQFRRWNVFAEAVSELCCVVYFPPKKYTPCTTSHPIFQSAKNEFCGTNILAGRISLGSLFWVVASGSYCCQARTGTGISSRTRPRWNCVPREAAASSERSTLGWLQLAQARGDGRSSPWTGSLRRPPWHSSAVTLGSVVSLGHLCRQTLGCSLSMTPEAHSWHLLPWRFLPVWQQIITSMTWILEYTHTEGKIDYTLWFL